MGEPKHGRCACASGSPTNPIFGGPGCCLGTGPAAFEVTRDGEVLRVCTRCDLSTDTDRRQLVTRDDDFTPYEEHDSLGAFCLELPHLLDLH